MKAPISLRSDPESRPFKVNSDPQALDEYYIRMLGTGGEKMLSEEVKWQAVTHKSFDQGRRGFNDRLAFLGMCCYIHHPRLKKNLEEMSTDKISTAGKWIVQLQTSLALVQDRTSTNPLPERDSYNRIRFRHAALEGLDDLTHGARSEVINKKQLAQLGHKYGLQQVIRWAPKNVS